MSDEKGWGDFVKKSIHSTIAADIDPHEITGVWVDEAHLLDYAMGALSMTGTATTASTSTAPPVDPTKEKYEKLCRILNKVFGDDRKVLALAGPCSMAVKDRLGKYHTKGFIGGEKFTLASAYLGKKGKVIYVLKPVFAAEYVAIEVPANRVNEVEGLPEYLKRVNARIDNEIIRGLHESQVEVVDLPVLTDQATKENPLFGSW